MKFEELFNKVLSRMSHFQDLDFGRFRPNFKCTVYFFSGRCLCRTVWYYTKLAFNSQIMQIFSHYPVYDILFEILK